MTVAIVTDDLDAVVTEIEISAPPERVFEALTTREQALVWWSNADYAVTEWEMDARIGGSWRFTATVRKGSAMGKAYRHHGEILEFDPPRLLVYSWFMDAHEIPDRKTIVRYELTPSGSGTRLKVTHSGLAALPLSRKGYVSGWPGVLSQIKQFTETRKD
jgi:uncharacterized protein YndB with AHSA1/START domain